MLVSKWLGRSTYMLSTYMLTLDVYGDWIPKDDDAAANSLPEPTAGVAPAKMASNVVKLVGRQSS